MDWYEGERLEELESLVNLTPLIDVLLVILLTLMMSVGINTFQSQVELPIGEPVGEMGDTKGHHLEIFQDGSLQLNGEKIDLEGLKKLNQKKIELNIYCHKNIPYETLIRVLTSAQLGGYQTFQFHYQEQ